MKKHIVVINSLRVAQDLLVKRGTIYSGRPASPMLELYAPLSHFLLISMLRPVACGSVLGGRGVRRSCRTAHFGRSIDARCKFFCTRMRQNVTTTPSHTTTRSFCRCYCASPRRFENTFIGVCPCDVDNTAFLIRRVGACPTDVLQVRGCKHSIPDLRDHCGARTRPLAITGGPWGREPVTGSAPWVFCNRRPALA